MSKVEMPTIIVGTGTGIELRPCAEVACDKHSCCGGSLEELEGNAN